MNLPKKLPDPLHSKHQKIYQTVNQLRDFLEYFIMNTEKCCTCNGCPRHGNPAGGASPSNKATTCTHHHTNGYKCGLPIPWESDYAAIWERTNDVDYDEDDVRQDILELIRRTVK